MGGKIIRALRDMSAMTLVVGALLISLVLGAFELIATIQGAVDVPESVQKFMTWATTLPNWVQPSVTIILVSLVAYLALSNDHRAAKDRAASLKERIAAIAALEEATTQLRAKEISVEIVRAAMQQRLLMDQRTRASVWPSGISYLKGITEQVLIHRPERPSGGSVSRDDLEKMLSNHQSGMSVTLESWFGDKYLGQLGYNQDDADTPAEGDDLVLDEDKGLYRRVIHFHNRALKVAEEVDNIIYAQQLENTKIVQGYTKEQLERST